MIAPYTSAGDNLDAGAPACGTGRRPARGRHRSRLRRAGLADLLGQIEGFRCAVVVNRTPERAVDALRFAGANEVVVVDDPDAARQAVARGVAAVTTDPGVAIALDELDVIVEGTGSLDHGAEVMLAARQAGREVVSINAEVDATIGWLLHCSAAAHGGVYTISDGDQPGVLMRTVDRVRHMGFDPVVVVNCKRHLDVHQSSIESAVYAVGTRPASS